MGINGRRNSVTTKRFPMSLINVDVSSIHIQRFGGSLVSEGWGYFMEAFFVVVFMNVIAV